MRNSMIALVAALPFAWACAGSIPPPTQRMAEAEAAERSAREVGADANPAAKLEVKLAQEQIAQAKAAMANGDNKRADFLLMRARADAELGLALAREQNATVETQKAVEQSNATANQGAKP